MTEGSKSLFKNKGQIVVCLLLLFFMSHGVTELGWLHAKQGVSCESAWINLASLCHLTVSDTDVNSLAEFGIQAIVVSRLPHDFVCFCGRPREILSCFYALEICKRMCFS